MGSGSSKSRGGGGGGGGGGLGCRAWGAHDGGVCCASVSDDGDLLLTGGEDARAALWSTRTFAKLAALEGHESYLTDCALAPGGGRAFTASADGTVRVWRIDRGDGGEDAGAAGGGALGADCARVLRGHAARVNRLLVHGGRTVYSTSADRTVRRWDAEDGSSLAVYEGHTGNVLPLALYVPESDSDKSESDKSESDKGESDKGESDKGEGGAPAQVVLATGGMDGTVRLWDEAGAVLHCLEGHAGPVLCLAVLHEKATLFSGGADGTVRRWDVLKGEAVSEFTENLGSVICMQVEGRYLYAGGKDGMARRWETRSQICARSYQPHARAVGALVVHRNVLFTGSGDGSACSYHAQTGAVMKTLKGHNRIINCMKVAGDTLFTGSQDGSIRAWGLQRVFSDAQEKQSDKNNEVADQLESKPKEETVADEVNESKEDGKNEENASTDVEDKPEHKSEGEKGADEVNESKKDDKTDENVSNDVADKEEAKSEEKGADEVNQ